MPREILVLILIIAITSATQPQLKENNLNRGILFDPIEDVQLKTRAWNSPYIFPHHRSKTSKKT